MWGGKGVEVAMPPISPLSKVLETNFFFLLLLYGKKMVIDKKEKKLYQQNV